MLLLKSLNKSITCTCNSRVFSLDYSPGFDPLPHLTVMIIEFNLIWKRMLHVQQGVEQTLGAF